MSKANVPVQNSHLSMANYSLACCFQIPLRKFAPVLSGSSGLEWQYSGGGAGGLWVSDLVSKGGECRFDFETRISLSYYLIFCTDIINVQ